MVGEKGNSVENNGGWIDIQKKVTPWLTKTEQYQRNDKKNRM